MTSELDRLELVLDVSYMEQETAEAKLTVERRQREVERLEQLCSNLTHHFDGKLVVCCDRAVRFRVLCLTPFGLTTKQCHIVMCVCVLHVCQNLITCLLLCRLLFDVGVRKTIIKQHCNITGELEKQHLILESKSQQKDKLIDELHVRLCSFLVGRLLTMYGYTTDNDMMINRVFHTPHYYPCVHAANTSHRLALGLKTNEVKYATSLSKLKIFSRLVADPKTRAERRVART